jgi:hypothetical protein
VELLSSREVELGWSVVLVVKWLEWRRSGAFYRRTAGAPCTWSGAEEKWGGSSWLGEMGGVVDHSRLRLGVGSTRALAVTIRERQRAA